MIGKITREKFDSIMSTIEYKMVQNEYLYDEIERELGDAEVQKSIENSFLKELVDFAAAALEDEDGIIENIVYEHSGAMPCEIKLSDNTLTFETWGDLYDYFYELSL